MALFRCGSGAPLELDNLTTTGKTLLGSITTYNGSWTATEDCVMFGYVTGSAATAAQVMFDGEVISMVYGDSGPVRATIGMNALGANISYAKYGMFVPKGTVVTTRNSSATTYWLQFYSIK